MTFLLLFGMIMNGISAHYIRKKAELQLPSPYRPLPDMMHTIFPTIPVVVPDYFLLYCICMTLYYYQTLVDVEKNIRCLEICVLIRSWSVWLTIMPTCMPKPKQVTNIYSRLFLSTHDLMFSGHSLFFIAMGHMLQSDYIQYIGPFLLVIARQHYTIDVFVSGLMYFFIYKN